MEIALLFLFLNFIWRFPHAIFILYLTHIQCRTFNSRHTSGDIKVLPKYVVLRLDKHFPEERCDVSNKIADKCKHFKRISVRGSKVISIVQFSVYKNCAEIYESGKKISRVYSTNSILMAWVNLKCTMIRKQPVEVGRCWWTDRTAPWISTADGMTTNGASVTWSASFGSGLDNIHDHRLTTRSSNKVRIDVKTFMPKQRLLSQTRKKTPYWVWKVIQASFYKFNIFDFGKHRISVLHFGLTEVFSLLYVIIWFRLPKAISYGHCPDKLARDVSASASTFFFLAKFTLCLVSFLRHRWRYLQL